MGFDPQNSGLAEQQMLTKRDIASVFHVDPALIDVRPNIAARADFRTCKVSNGSFGEVIDVLIAGLLIDEHAAQL